jgi:quercetin dioxygenase-like cupin family protein
VSSSKGADVDLQAPGVRRPEDVALEKWDDPTRGNIGFRTLFGSDGDPRAGLTAGVAELDAGGRLSIHRHDPAEVYHVLEGTGVVTVGDLEHPVSTGASVLIPPGVPHGIRNTGRSVLRVFYVLAADRMTDVEYDFTRA